MGIDLYNKEDKSLVWVYSLLDILIRRAAIAIEMGYSVL